MKVDKLEKGTVLSETSFYKVTKVESDHVVVNTDDGVEVKLSNAYVEKILDVADYFDSEEKKTATELADILLNNPRVAMTVAFYKKDETKPKKVYEAEKKAKIEEIQSASLANASKLLEDLIENPISKVIPGELRIIKGRHEGHQNDLGRLHFVDMNLEKTAKDRDDRERQVDPRTIQYVIVRGVKYSLKK